MSRQAPYAEHVMGEWHLVTGEYPPQHGGVSDYSWHVAAGMAAAGEKVHVWCPPAAGGGEQVAGVEVHRELGRIGVADLIRANRLLDEHPGPRRILVQWVPHAYRARAMNIPFAFWLWTRAHLRGDQLYVMVHEAHVAFGDSWKSNVIAAANRVMDALLLTSTRRVWVSTPAWADALRPFSLGRKVEFSWLPVPSNVPRVSAPEASRALRARYAPNGQRLIGHFGTYGRLIAPLLHQVLPELLREEEEIRVLLLGRGAAAFRDELSATHPELARKLIAPEPLDDRDLSAHIAACDLFIQPYPEGLSCRRGTAMAVMGHGKAMVTNSGRFTEPVWADRKAVLLTDPFDMAALAVEARKLVRNDAELRALEAAAAALYEDAFDVRHTVAAMLAVDGSRQPNAAEVGS